MEVIKSRYAIHFAKITMEKKIRMKIDEQRITDPLFPRS